MNESLRQKKVGSLIKEALSRSMIEVIQDSNPGLITITRVEMTKDLKTAFIYCSFFGGVQNEYILEMLKKRTGYFRKSIASGTNLKYNPQLIFSMDPIPDYEEKINKIIENIKNNEK